MDREWSTSALGTAVEGWDSVAIPLDDGRELMVYLLRRRDGTIDPFSAGTLVAADGTTRRLEAEDVRDRRHSLTGPARTAACGIRRGGG